MVVLICAEQGKLVYNGSLRSLALYGNLKTGERFSVVVRESVSQRSRGQGWIARKYEDREMKSSEWVVAAV
jgi:hypothetical protein